MEPVALFCAYCGQAISQNHNFCPFCGKAKEKNNLTSPNQYSAETAYIFPAAKYLKEKTAKAVEAASRGKTLSFLPVIGLLATILIMALSREEVIAVLFDPLVQIIYSLVFLTLLCLSFIYLYIYRIYHKKLLKFLNDLSVSPAGITEFYANYRTGALKFIIITTCITAIAATFFAIFIALPNIITAWKILSLKKAISSRYTEFVHIEHKVKELTQ